MAYVVIRTVGNEVVKSGARTWSDVRKEVADLADDDFVVVRRVGTDMFFGSAGRCPATEPDVPWTGEEDVDKWSDLARDLSYHLGSLPGDDLFDSQHGLVARAKRMAAELAAAKAEAARRPEAWSLSSLGGGPRMLEDDGMARVSIEADGFLGLRSRMR